MSGLGQDQPSSARARMSAIPPKADIAKRDCHVRFVPEADVSSRSKATVYSITSSARSKVDVGTDTPIALAVFKLSANSKLVGCSTGRSDGFAPPENLGHKRRSAAKYRKRINAVRHQPARLDIVLEGEHRRQAVLYR